MNKSTLFVSDLDGTLLGTDSKVSETTAKILNTLIAKEDLLFTIATARTPATAVPLMSKVNIELPLIVMTGAATWSLEGNCYSNTHTIEAEKVGKIVEICHTAGINPFVYSQNGNTLDVMHSPILNSQEEEFVAERRNAPFKHFFLKNKLEYQDAILIFAANKFAKIQEIASDISAKIECEVISYHDIYSTDNGFLEVFAPRTSKAKAIKDLAEKIGANKIVVFGDNLNDIPMLKIADVAIAMDNAYPEVKEVAHITIGNNADDSVAHWIEKNLNTI
ncbi:MAG: HAD family hydrolase [Muribaculaceae bacterium]|nr:HAD family hydrolase [Muribaculaceae bacterium]